MSDHHHITTRPISSQVRCVLAGERCGQGKGMWIAKHLEGAPLRYAANKVIVAYEDGQLTHMGEFIELMRELARQRKDIGWQLAAENFRGTLQLARGELDAARGTFEYAANVANQPDYRVPFAAELQDAIFGWALTAYDIENVQEFEQLVGNFDGLVGSLGCLCADDVRTLVLSGLRHLMLGRVTNAASCFQRIISQFGDATPFYRFVATFGIAECALLNGDTSSAQAQFETIAHLVDHGQGHGAVISWLRRFPHAHLLAERLYSHWELISGEQMQAIKQHLVPRRDARLEIRAFGNGEVVLAGQTRDFSGARQAMVLLTYLALYPEGRRREHICQALWPHSLNDQGLLKALHEIRRQLGEESVLCENSVYYINPDYAPWLDVSAFLETYDRAMRLPRDAKEDALMSCALLYRGPFLQMAVMTWVDEMRQKLMLKMASAWWHIAKCAAERKDVDLSIEYLFKALEVDPLYETGVAALMRQFDSSGQRVHAVRLYETYSRRMEKMFQMRPSPLIQELYRRLCEEQQLLTGAFDVKDLQQVLARSTPPLLVRPAAQTEQQHQQQQGDPTEQETEEVPTSVWIN